MCHVKGKPLEAPGGAPDSAAAGEGGLREGSPGTHFVGLLVAEGREGRPVLNVSFFSSDIFVWALLLLLFLFLLVSLVSPIYC